MPQYQITPFGFTNISKKKKLKYFNFFKDKIIIFIDFYKIFNQQSSQTAV